MHIVQDLENSTGVANVVANVTAVVVDVAVRRRRLRRRRTRNHGGSMPGRSFRVRTRRSVEDIYKQLAKVYFRRAYRMKYRTFKRLAHALRPYIIAASGQKGGPPGSIRNGPISSDVRLACAIRWFAGGSVYDLMSTYGISQTDTVKSFWFVVLAINRNPNFNIEYPSDHEEQKRIAQGFHAVSSAGFKSCAGAIDGLLVWIHKPAPKDCIDSGCSSGKFMCARKMKFGESKTN